MRLNMTDMFDPIKADLSALFGGFERVEKIGFSDPEPTNDSIQHRSHVTTAPPTESTTTYDEYKMTENIPEKAADSETVQVDSLDYYQEDEPYNDSNTDVNGSDSLDFHEKQDNTRLHVQYGNFLFMQHFIINLRYLVNFCYWYVL